MDELACFNDSWDLEAILNDVDSPLIINDDPNNTTSISHFFSQQDDHHHDHELLCSTFPEFSETTNLLIDEYLSQELYKYKPSLINNPAVCHSHGHSSTTLSSQTIVTSSISTSTIPKELQPSEEVALQLVPIASKYIGSKKKKKKKKVVVKKVRRMDGSFSDEWTWRKYGQKPIKGNSSYPRSYYRCSSSKGCLARKQVEKNHLDPEVFLVTYTNAEHNHIQPSTHHGRNSLLTAGTGRSTRKKNNSSSTTSPFVSSSTVTETETETHDYSPKPPRTPLGLATSSNSEDVLIAAATKTFFISG